MATDNEIKYLGPNGTEQLVATVKDLLINKQDKGNYATLDDVSESVRDMINQITRKDIVDIRIEEVR